MWVPTSGKSASRLGFTPPTVCRHSKYFSRNSTDTLATFTSQVRIPIFFLPSLIGALDEPTKQVTENTKKSKLAKRSQSVKPDANANEADDGDPDTHSVEDAREEDDDHRSRMKHFTKIGDNWQSFNTEALRKTAGTALRERWCTYLWESLPFLIFCSVSRP